MPIVVCAVCLAQGFMVDISTGYYTLVDGTAYCQDHIPPMMKAHAKNAPKRAILDYGEPKKKRGRPPKGQAVLGDDR